MNEFCFSGKTTLSKAVSTVASTAAFDKNPQSKERGITLDLGFSSFTTSSANHIQEIFPQTQYTLVDCPGHGKFIFRDNWMHSIFLNNEKIFRNQFNKLLSPFFFLASLIKTIIGGAQIIDLMILVVDITKGIQTQTAECLVIGEITCSRMIVVLNKIDSIQADKRDKTIEKVNKIGLSMP